MSSVSNKKNSDLNLQQHVLGYKNGLKRNIFFERSISLQKVYTF